ncbi:MAG: hypothetical protein F6K00_31600 [Leptolyngbya sp. SIOISBB]|nr:hypothetical protein [Leptolyngbya sp. SIOISBB]
MTDKVYSSETIENCRQGLTELAAEPRTQFNCREAVEALFDSIEEALADHTYSEVAKRLGEQGLAISAGSLKHYVLRLRRERNGNGQKAATAKKRKGNGKGSGKRSHTAAPSPSVTTGKIRETTKEITRAPQLPLPEQSDEVQLAY